MNDYINSDAGKLADLIIYAAERSALKKAVFSKPADKKTVRTVLTCKVIKDNNYLQAESFMSDNKALHKNYRFDMSLASSICDLISGFSQVNLLTTAGECEFRRSKSGSTVLIGADKLRSRLDSDKITQVLPEGNNRVKRHILDGSEPFLRLLGVSDDAGRVYDKKQPKFRQINRFLKMIRDILGELPEKEIRICDLCCGKSYLSFAVYHYFSDILGYKVRMTGVDLKSDVIEYCSGVARSLGFDGLDFVCGNIEDYSTDRLPDLVISLHACDTATDIVLRKAVGWNTKVILSTPCCHHELNHTLNCPELSFIAEHSMLRQKFCDAATDALRLKMLEANGYETAALELIDPDETPKNIMLRAIKMKNPSPQTLMKAQDEYKRASAFLLGK